MSWRVRKGCGENGVLLVWERREGIHVKK